MPSLLSLTTSVNLANVKPANPAIS